MPLIHGKSKRAFSHNVAAEVNAGKPQNQAVAIAYSEKRRAQHKGDGGIVKCMEAGKSDCHSHYAEGGEVKCPTCGMKNCMAHGGEAEEPMEIEMEGGGDKDKDAALDSELQEMVSEELMNALEKKDKKGIVEAIKALVMSCME